MNEPEALEPTTHQQAILLPWYVAGTLDDREKLEVETHLKNCETCRMEFDEIQRTQLAVKAAIGERQGPSPAVLTKVMSRIREEKASAQHTTSQPVHEHDPGLWSRLESWLQSLFATPWVPVLATALIVGQSAFLLTNLGGPSSGSDPAGQGPGPIIERGIPKAPTPVHTSRLQVTFAESATQGDIQSLLRTIEAQVTRGPLPDGSYILTIPTTNHTQIQDSLQTLLAKPQLIRSAISVSP
ncbi:MAG: zf-HC2 domain-containing protein [Nitrospirales bacterium]|nr:zf-HC2 domain-containing protein [Nitrospira sp.]MDR4501528.1 zf-HC2 domain-containing protein [Nitrospirales bacterium]